MKNRCIYRLFLIIMMGVYWAFPSCQDKDLASLPLNEQDVPEGYVAVTFNASVPDMTEVQTRAVDPDGLLVHNNMTLFCFNEMGLYMARVKAVFPENYTNAEEGTFTAIIPKDTHIIHFVANQNDAIYDGMNLTGITEDRMQSTMVGASGMMIYWARFECTPDGGAIDEQLKTFCGTDVTNSNSIELIRNHAKLSIGESKDDWTSNDYFTVTGFVATNIRAFGTTAPYHVEHGFPTCNDTDFGEENYWWTTTEFVTLPEDEKYLVMMSDIADVDTKEEDYLFEHENTSENPVSVIIKGKNKNAGESAPELYYRVMLMDDAGNFIRIRRNHWYQINIDGQLTHGQTKFEDALTAPPTNNVWVAVEDWVTEISNDDYRLSVSETSKVVDDSKKGQILEFTYTITSVGNNSLTEDDRASVSWLKDNHVANYAIDHEFSVSGNVGTGTIRIELVSNMPDEVSQLAGQLLVEKGNLQRKIEVVMIKTMFFKPSWVSAQVYSNLSGENVTLKFTIPEDCPQSLFPFPVLVTVNDLDVRSASGQQLPIRLKGQDGWFGQDGLGYKYEYMVENPGVHRLYFTTVLPHHDVNNNNSSGNETEVTEEITLEANFFNPLTKHVLFSQLNNVIQLPVWNEQYPNPHAFRAFYNNNETNYDPTLQKDEPIYYLLVPQKKNAEVNFQVNLATRSAEKNDEGKYTYTSIASGANDEFLLYSKYLNLDGVTGDYTVGSESTNSENGRYEPFYPDGTGDDNFVLKATTTTARSADVVRVASNNLGSASLKNSGSGYAGGEYRSAIFELANYRPFGFAAKVKANNQTVGKWGVDNNYLLDSNSSHVEPEDIVTLTYQPDESVEISFDVTSFVGALGTDVDPFGTPFKIYIDAPMLVIDGNRNDLQANKFYQESSGRFVYVVDADGQTENQVGVNGRKTLYFKKKGITADGDIVLSSEEDVVVFYKKTFHVDTQKITGNITYGVSGTETLVPASSFVAFARKYNGTRVGSLTVTADGQYSLNLRSEYEFTWKEEMEIDYVDKDGNTYEYITTLQNLYANSTIALVKQSSD